MPFQPPLPAAPPLESTPHAEPRSHFNPKPAPVWLQRLSLVVLVAFCLYLGFMVAILPWWRQVWENNTIVLNHPQLGAFLRHGAVRGVISGIGLLDIWIGISEAIHYRDYRG
jgi:hypothetical protein